MPHRARLLVVEHGKGKPSITRLNSTGRLERSAIRATGSIWSGLREDTRKAIWRSLKSDFAIPPECEWALHNIKAVDPPSLFERALVRLSANSWHDGMCANGYTIVFVTNRSYQGRGERGIVDLSTDEMESKYKKKKKASTDPAGLDQQYGDSFQDSWPQQAQFPDPFFDHDPEMPAYGPPQEPPPGAIPVPQHGNSYVRPATPPSTMPFPPVNPFPPDPRFFPQAQAQAFDQFDNRQPQNSAMNGYRRPDQYAPYPRQRETANRDRLLSQERRKLARLVSDEVRSVMREAAVEDRAQRRRPADALGAQTSIMHSDEQDDFWSNSSSSGDRRYDYSAPGGRIDPTRTEHQFSRLASSGARPYVDDRKRYYMDRNRDDRIKPKPPGSAEERARRDDSSTAHRRYRSMGRRLSSSSQDDERGVSDASEESLEDAELFEQLLRKFTGHGLRDSEIDDDVGADGDVVEGLDDGSVDDEGHNENHVDGTVGRNVDETVDENGNGIANCDTHDDITDPTPRASGVDQAQGTV